MGPFNYPSTEEGFVKKTILISGGLGVLGQGFAKVLIRDGFDVLLLDVKEPEQGREFSGEFFKADITSEADIARLKACLAARGTQVYGLINNASCQPPGFIQEIEDYSPDTFRKVLDVNLVGSFLLAKTVLPFMKEHHAGVIVNIGSIQGVVAPTFEIYEGTKITSPLVYAVAKAGLIHFCKWVAKKYGKWNIRCNAVSPGGLGDSQRGGSAFADIYSSRVPLGRMVMSEEVADVIAFMFSDKARYITGQNILVDGGWTIY